MNGKEGDHPISDIVEYGRSVFTPEIDELIRQLDRLGYWQNGVASLYILEFNGQIRDPMRYAQVVELSSPAVALNNMQILLQFELERLQSRAP